MACRMRTSLNVPVSTRMVNGFQPPPAETRTFLPSPWTSEITSSLNRLTTSTWPASSAFTWLVWSL